MKFMKTEPARSSAWIISDFNKNAILVITRIAFFYALIEEYISLKPILAEAVENV